MKLEEERKRGEPLGRFAAYADGARGMQMDYYTRPSEVRARLNVIRKLAGETGIYDPFNEPLTMEGLEKLYDDMNANSKRRKDRAKDSGIWGEVQKAGKYKPLTELNKYYTKEQILELLNEVAYNKPSSDGSGMTVLEPKTLRYKNSKPKKLNPNVENEKRRLNNEAVKKSNTRRMREEQHGHALRNQQRP